MSVVFRTDARVSRWRVSALFITVLAVAVLGVGPFAWSFEVIKAPSREAQAAASVMRMPEVPAGDSCLYILRHAQERNRLSAYERYDRQSAGSVAAIGLVFGVRFALGPTEARYGTGSMQALAIADYRACRNEQALRTLTD